MPHVPLFVSDKFAGKSGTGLYGDVIMLIDLVHDPQEKLNVIDQYPEIAEQFMQYADRHRAYFFD